MKTTDSYIVSCVDVTTSDGIKFPLTQTTYTNTKYHNVKRLNSRIHIMDFMEAQINICKSSKDIHILRNIINDTDKKAIFSNISNFTKKHTYSHATVKNLIKRAVDNRLLARVSRGTYMVNPYILAPSWLKGKEIEILQGEWDILSP